MQPIIELQPFCRARIGEVTSAGSAGLSRVPHGGACPAGRRPALPDLYEGRTGDAVAADVAVRLAPAPPGPGGGKPACGPGDRACGVRRVAAGHRRYGRLEPGDLKLLRARRPG